MTTYGYRTYNEQYTMIELTDASTNSTIILCPERGGIAVSCVLHGRELFYLDNATLQDRSANIRGGNPVLFPICGPLTEGQYEWEGHTYSMKQHGLARQMSWEVLALTANDSEARASLRLKSTSETLAVYPFEFELIFDYVLQDGRLRIEQSYRNTGAKRMPFYAGFHPYFASINGAIPYQTDATRIYDCNDELEKPLPERFEADQIVESHVLLDPREPVITFQPAPDVSIKLSYSPVFKYVVLWSIPGKPFICVEPWMAKNYELNYGRELELIEPGDQLQAVFTIERAPVS